MKRAVSIPANAQADLPVNIPSRILFALLSLTAAAAHAADDDHFKLGLGAAIAPRYEGADEYRMQPFPVVDAQYGRFFARSGDGLGLNIWQSPQLTIGAGLNMMDGYSESDVPEGIGKLSDTLGARVFVSTNAWAAILTVSATQAISKSERGLIANARVSYPYSVSERFKVIPSVSVEWANAKYMKSYFGINAQQAARSGLSEYRPSAGFKDVSLRVGFSYELTKTWSITGAAGVSRLMGDAADSPLVRRKSQAVGALGVAYRF
ncbi:MltA-interacting MipA family protein [Advenella kashmirensis WT001]|uniref:MltA-interacting MipA family protein n=1 Tax=Advenella kashmirensis (strain DSM 17095 / LMG 22695 / WT001) TaxID=1036672 RepID=I3UHC2_ADVKW|nr:MipA/OmpV family protein [Advenella kashmirensis]AFK64410.1 MltA-interacting MipA family protein [Advenella kashmirensis WT001]